MASHLTRWQSYWPTAFRSLTVSCINKYLTNIYMLQGKPRQMSKTLPRYIDAHFFVVQAPRVTTGTFADGTVVLTCHNDVLRTSFCLQKWVQVTFTLRRDPDPPVYLNNVEIPPATTVKYLGMRLDNKPNWKEHISEKWKQMDLRHK